MNWRPDDSSGWIANREHCIKIILDTCNNDESDHINIFEAGADAMLETVKAQGIYVEDSEVQLSIGDDSTPWMPGGSGWSVWIPNDTKEGER